MPSSLRVRLPAHRNNFKLEISSLKLVGSGLAGEGMMSGGYFLYHSIGQYPGKEQDLARAMAAFARTWSAGNDAQWGEILAGHARFLDRWRAIFGAAPGTVAHCESVTQGLHRLVTALPPERLKGRKVLVAADCFPSNHFLLSGLAPRLGFALETVPPRQGAAHVEDEDFLARWTPDVGLALLTWISSTTSARIDLAPLVAHGRAMGSLVGVDITQGAGLLPFDVTAPAVDFALSTSLKWMCGTPGAGALYISPALLPETEPELRGWFSQENPFSWSLDAFRLAPDARRFDNGTPGIMAALATLPALDWHAGADRSAILDGNRRMTARLIAACDHLRLTLMTPRPEARRGGSVMLRLPEGRPAAAVLDTLRRADLWADARGQTLRLSPGVLTTEDGLDRLIATLGASLA
jgi:selenocysteine lyase/cysteine desulfurase